MTESTQTTCTPCSTKTFILRVITWVLLITTIALWMVNATIATAAVASLTFTLGIIAACLFLLFFAAQLMG
jgi:hypothetical protein